MPDPILSELLQLRAENAALRRRDPAGRRWYPSDADYRRIWEHMTRQAGLSDPRNWVKLDDGRIVRVGADAAGEGDATPPRVRKTS